MKLTQNNYLFNFKKCIFLSLIFISSYTFGEIPVQSQEEYQLKNIEMNNNTKSEAGDDVEIPTNPFEIVEMIRRSTMMDDATNPSDAIDEALKSFDMLDDD